MWQRTAPMRRKRSDDRRSNQPRERGRGIASDRRVDKRRVPDLANSRKQSRHRRDCTVATRAFANARLAAVGALRGRRGAVRVRLRRGRLHVFRVVARRACDTGLMECHGGVVRRHGMNRTAGQKAKAQQRTEQKSTKGHASKHSGSRHLPRSKGHGVRIAVGDSTGIEAYSH